VGDTPAEDQIYRITFDGSVSDDPGFVAFGGQADQVSARLKEKFSDGMSLTEALGAALDALTVPPVKGSGGPASGELAATGLEVAILDRARDHRTFRRLRGARLEELIAQVRGEPASAALAPEEAGEAAGTPAPDAPASDSPASGPPAEGTQGKQPGDDDPPTGPPPGGSDGAPKGPAL
jgi:proteasome alpha subunit